MVSWLRGLGWRLRRTTSTAKANPTPPGYTPDRLASVIEDPSPRRTPSFSMLALLVNWRCYATVRIPTSCQHITLFCCTCLLHWPCCICLEQCSEVSHSVRSHYTPPARRFVNPRSAMQKQPHNRILWSFAMWNSRLRTVHPFALGLCIRK